MNSTMKKWMGVAVAAMLAGSVVALAGCSSSSSGSASASASSASASASSAEASSEAASSEAESTEAASSEAASTEAESAESASSTASAGMANPWHEAASAEEAAKGAGLDSFPLPEGAIADLGEPIEITYRYMDGMAEARYDFPASAVTARTAALNEGDLYDISGDYNTYKHEWTETIANLPIACAGNREGESTKTYWGEDDANIAHSLVAEGLGGDMDFGLNVDRLTVFVEAMS